MKVWNGNLKQRTPNHSTGKKRIGKTLITYRYGNTKAVERKGILMNKTFLYSPYRGDVAKNIAFAKRTVNHDVGLGGVVHVKG